MPPHARQVRELADELSPQERLVRGQETAAVLLDPGAFSPDAPEPTDEHVYEPHEQVYQAHEQFEDDPKYLHHDVGDVVKEARRAKHQGE
jgi:hypothetical protein